MIKVKPEGKDGVWLVEKEEAKKAIDEYKEKQVHCLINTGPVLSGAHWNKKEVKEYIDVAKRIAILTGESQEQNLYHALSVIVNNELYMFDIGPVKESELEIVEDKNG